MQKLFEQPSPAAQWMTRLLSLGVNAVMLVLVAIVLTNDDPLPPQGRPVLALLGVCVAASLASWRWPRLGGWLTLAGAAALGVAASASSLVTGLGPLGLALAWLIYPLPYFVLGGLSLALSAAPTAPGRQ